MLSLILSLVAAQLGSAEQSTGTAGNANSNQEPARKGKLLIASESTANTVAIPQQILRTGINISSTDVSPNTRQLADDLGLTPLFARANKLKSRLAKQERELALDTLVARQELSETQVKINQIIMEASLDVDFVLAEISAEHTLYSDILAAYQENRDKVVARYNSQSYYANGILWAIGEAYDIPTYKYPRLSIPSGTISILAGVVPSALSLYAMRKFNGRKADSEVAPNMLAKIFDYPTTPEIEYPESVWKFLTSVPADANSDKTRRDQLIDRWISDKNIPTFTDRKSRKQLDVVTASVSQRKGLSIDTLNVRQVMLTQLGAEVMKMKRLLLELAMVARDKKHI